MFSDDGTFQNIQGDETWLEPWQGVDTEECGSPAAPNDGSAPATFAYDGDANTLTISGAGAYIGLPKAVNGAEIASAADVPASITYNAYLNDDGTMDVTVEAGAGVWWNYVLTRD